MSIAGNVQDKEGGEAASEAGSMWAHLAAQVGTQDPRPFPTRPHKDHSFSHSQPCCLPFRIAPVPCSSSAQHSRFSRLSGSINRLPQVSSLKAELSSLSSDPRLASSPPLPQASHGVADGLLKKVEELRGSAKGKDEGASTSAPSTDPQANVSHFHPTSSQRTFDI